MGTADCRICSILKPSKLLLFNSVPPVGFTLLMRNAQIFTSAFLLEFQLISHIKKELEATPLPSRQVSPPGLTLHGPYGLFRGQALWADSDIPSGLQGQFLSVRAMRHQQGMPGWKLVSQSAGDPVLSTDQRSLLSGEKKPSMFLIKNMSFKESK